MENKLSDIRNGKFTSSVIHNLMGFDRSKTKPGEKAKTYVQQVRIERKLRRSLKSMSNADPLVWGRVIEKMAFDKLPLDYEFSARDTIVNKDFPTHCGTPDIIKGDTVGDIKCPYTLESYCRMYEGDIPDQYYWQLVSNSILTGCSKAELIIFAPTEDDLDSIYELGRGTFIQYRSPEHLPIIPKESDYHNLMIIPINIKDGDREFLMERLAWAEEYILELDAINQKK